MSNSVKFLEFIKNFIDSNSLKIDVLLEHISNSEFSCADIYNQCIELLLQLNYTGPSDTTIETLLNSNMEMNKLINEEFTCEGEVPFFKTQGIILLWIAKSVTTQMRKMQKDVYRSCIGFLKCIFIHQATLQDERSALLKSQVDECCNQAMEYKAEIGEIDPLDEFQFLMLSCHLNILYYDYDQSENMFNKIQELLGISISFNGALGKKTKFQETNISQLYIDLSRQPSITAEKINNILEKERNKNLPNDQMQDDDIYLNETEFLQNDAPFTKISPTLAEQAALVLKSRVHKLSRATCETTVEECKAILSCALGNCTTRSSLWSLVTDALLQRCQLPYMSTSRKERALMQMEEISGQFSHLIPTVKVRTAWFFLSRLPSIWEIQVKWAEILMAMELYKSALDVLLPWQQWKTIIPCLIQLGESGRAEQMIRERIQIEGESVEMLCYLGDVTRDRVNYEKAWELSKHKSARSMRCLAQHFMYTDKDHLNASICFEKSLECNHLQVNTWFTYGCCCLLLREYRKAVTAFKNCVCLEPDNFEAWNNCASALIELGDKKSALVQLQQAVKYNYDNWRVWDNICIVSAQINDFNTTIRAYHRVMDLKDQHRDPATLSIMTSAVIKNNDDEILPKLKKLFARIVSQDGRDPRIWMVYADFLSNENDLSDETKLRVLQCLSRAHHGMCPSGWEHDNAQCKRALTSALQLVNKSFEYNINYSSAKLAVKSIKTILQNKMNCQVENLNDDVNNLLNLINEADIELANKI